MSKTYIWIWEEGKFLFQGLFKVRNLKYVGPLGRAPELWSFLKIHVKTADNLAILPWNVCLGAKTLVPSHNIFIFLLGEGAIYQHQHVFAPSLTTTILPSYFKKILATNNVVLTLCYPAYFIPHNTWERSSQKSSIWDPFYPLIFQVS